MPTSSITGSQKYNTTIGSQFTFVLLNIAVSFSKQNVTFVTPVLSQNTQLRCEHMSKYQELSFYFGESLQFDKKGSGYLTEILSLLSQTRTTV